MNKYFLEPKSSGSRVKVELNLSNYATKRDLKNATGGVTSKFSKNIDLANLKSSVDKLDIVKLKKCSNQFKQFEKSDVDQSDIDQLVSAPLGLSKLSDAVKNDVVKKDVYSAKDEKY